MLAAVLQTRRPRIPLAVGIAAALAFPDGSMTAVGRVDRPSHYIELPAAHAPAKHSNLAPREADLALIRPQQWPMRPPPRRCNPGQLLWSLHSMCSIECSGGRRDQ